MPDEEVTNTTPTESNAYDITKFTKAPFVAAYNGTILGGTEGPISITPEIEYEDITCNQAAGKAIARIIKSIKYRITGTFKEVDTVIGAVFGLQNITADMIGKDILASGGSLVLTAIGTGNTKVYTFGKVTSRVTKYDLDGENIHGVEVEFETAETGDANGNILTVTGVAAGLGSISGGTSGGTSGGSSGGESGGSSGGESGGASGGGE